MSDSNVLNQQEESVEEKEQELVEKMRELALREKDRQELSKFFHVEDAEILDALQELGYSRETIFLLFLVPVVQVAWVDGRVTDKERSAITEIARLRGMEEGTPAEAKLQDWLSNRPSDEFFEKTLRLIRNILETRPPLVRKIRQQSLGYYCNVVANASGGFLGFGRVSSAQKGLMNKIFDKLEREHPEATAQIINEVHPTNDDN